MLVLDFEMSRLRLSSIILLIACWAIIDIIHTIAAIRVMAIDRKCISELFPIAPFSKPRFSLALDVIVLTTVVVFDHFDFVLNCVI